MSRRATWQLVLVFLGLLVLGAGSLLAASPRARVRWYAWRMGSHDAETRAWARERLFALGRSVTGDELYAAAIAEELCARIAPVASGDRVVFIGHAVEPYKPVVYYADTPLANVSFDWQVFSHPGPSQNLSLVSPASEGSSRHVLVGATKPEPGTLFHRVIIEIPVDGVESLVTEAVRAKLAARAP